MTGTVHRSFAIGTRDDPHAQEREARSAPVLLHSLSLFREVFGAIYAHRPISTVVEVGVETGQVSGIYAELGASQVFCVDPFPTDEVRSAVAAHDKLEFVEEFSPGALAGLPKADLYVIDGDHNYATVRAEADWILEHAPDAVVVFHDLMWPCGRRDFYYQPSVLSDEDVHAHSDEGPTVWHDGLTPAGLIGAGAYTVAIDAGGERNGVLTAVEDAVSAAADPTWQLEIIPAIYGVGVLMRRTDQTAELLEVVRRYSGSRLLAALENNRIALYTRVLQMQFEAVAHADEAERLAETIATQRKTIDELTSQIHGVTEQFREKVAELAVERATRAPADRRSWSRTWGRRLAGNGRRLVSSLLVR